MRELIEHDGRLGNQGPKYYTQPYLKNETPTPDI